MAARGVIACRRIEMVQLHLWRQGKVVNAQPERERELESHHHVLNFVPGRGIVTRAATFSSAISLKNEKQKQKTFEL